jgi:hypothetical protein
MCAALGRIGSFQEEVIACVDNFLRKRAEKGDRRAATIACQYILFAIPCKAGKDGTTHLRQQWKERQMRLEELVDSDFVDDDE